jgi:hypothetical protein
VNELRWEHRTLAVEKARLEAAIRGERMVPQLAWPAPGLKDGQQLKGWVEELLRDTDRAIPGHLT